MLNYSTHEIERLQDHLQLIRKAGGWTAEEFGEMIGVTKQTISNLENRRSPMTKTQYIAIRAVLDYEVKNNPDNAVLERIISLLLDDEEITEEGLEKAKSAAVYASGAKKTGLNPETVFGTVSALLGAVIAASTIAGANGSWLPRLLGKKNTP